MTISNLVLSLADNKRLLGLRYAEWATSAPSLEADIAAAAMGLDDLGHSSVLYGCLDQLGEDPRSPERESNAESYAHLAYFDQPFADWSHFVAANAILDSAFTVMIQACVDGNVEVLRTRLRKMLQEERYHHLHGRSWLREGIDPGVVVDAWTQAFEFFGPEDGDVAEFQRGGVLSAAPGELRAQLAERVGTSAPEVSIDWRQWDPIRRRVRPGGMDQRTFDMLRGLEERRFMPAGAGARAGA